MTSSTTTSTYPKHIPAISYKPSSPSRLQTLDIWLPRPIEQSDPATSLWVIYIHGGAWRDPLQDSSCILPTLNHLFSPAATTTSSALQHAPAVSHIAGIASLNYRLSPHPTHPTSPSAPNDVDRNAQHPTHIRDIARGIAYLQTEYGVKRWIGVGHSCGATMLLQYVAGIGIGIDESESESSESKSESAAETGRRTTTGPEALLLLEGIYNFPLLLHNHTPPTCPPPIAQIYRDFLAGAFGPPDQTAYQAVSPVSGKYDAGQWPEGKLLLVCHSYEDELVERAQRDVLCVALDRAGWGIVMEEGDEEDEVRGQEGRRVLNVRDLKGGHDWIWEDGEQIARLIGEVVLRLC